MPLTGPSGIGAEGPGNVAWIAYASDLGNWFPNAQSGDVVYRGTTNLRWGIRGIGSGSGNAPLNLSTSSYDILLPVSLPQSLVNLTTVGDQTLSASILSSGFISDSATQTADFTLTTDTAANLLAIYSNAQVGSSFKCRIINNDQSSTGYAATLAGGSGVTISSSLPNPVIAKGSWADFLFTFTSVGSSPAVTVSYVGQGTI